MVNPNPGLITDPMWNLWLNAEQVIPGVKLSGIYANKKGYHNTVNANKLHWPDNYSIKLPLDLVNYNRDKARAIDLTMSDSEMVKWTTRMKKAFENPSDARVNAVKEFYGTLDNKTVFGLSKDSIGGPVRRVTSDNSHLWHGHTSIFTAHVNSWNALSGLVSVWAGQTLEEWSDRMGLPIKGDNSEDVKYFQNTHNNVAKTVNPPSPILTVDGDYGSATQAAFLDFWKKSGGQGSYNGSSVTGWLAFKYLQALIKVNSATTPPVVDVKVIQDTVTAWMNKNLLGNIAISGELKGTLDVGPSN